jgi:hypothetical protein
MADPATGFRRIAAMGNAGQATSYLVRGLPPGEYSAAVQAIDPSFAGSAFSETLFFSFTNPEVSAEAVGVTEGNDGATAFQLIVVLSESSGLETTVTYVTHDGTAVAGTDYQPAAGTLIIEAGQTQGVIDLVVYGDQLIEPPDETFYLELSSCAGGVISDRLAEVTIIDDDSALIFADGFEGGDTASGSDTVP